MVAARMARGESEQPNTGSRPSPGTGRSKSSSDATKTHWRIEHDYEEMKGELWIPHPRKSDPSPSGARQLEKLSLPDRPRPGGDANSIRAPRPEQNRHPCDGN